MKIKTNLVGGIIFIVFGTVLLLLLNNQVITYGNISFLQSAKVAPFFSELIMIIGGIFLIIQSVFLKKDTIITISWNEQKNALITIGCLSLFAIGIYFLGFLIGSIIFILLMFRFYKNRNLYELIGLIILSIGIYFLFTMIFHVQLPGIGGVK